GRAAAGSIMRREATRLQGQRMEQLARRAEAEFGPSLGVPVDHGDRAVALLARGERDLFLLLRRRGRGCQGYRGSGEQDGKTSFHRTSPFSIAACTVRAAGGRLPRNNPVRSMKIAVRTAVFRRAP